jgi:hypothetical protein
MAEIYTKNYNNRIPKYTQQFPGFYNLTKELSEYVLQHASKPLQQYLSSIYNLYDIADSKSDINYLKKYGTILGFIPKFLTTTEQETIVYTAGLRAFGIRRNINNVYDITQALKSLYPEAKISVIDKTVCYTGAFTQYSIDDLMTAIVEINQENLSKAQTVLPLYMQLHVTGVNTQYNFITSGELVTMPYDTDHNIEKKELPTGTRYEKAAMRSIPLEIKGEKPMEKTYEQCITYNSKQTDQTNKIGFYQISIK